MTQAKLAAYLGMAQGRVSDRLRGKREWTPSDMDKLIALGVPLRLPEPVGGEQR